MRILKCLFTGHKLEKSIVNTINTNNWLKRCSTCGLYVMHGGFTDDSILLTKRQAMKVKREFEEAFPYAKQEGGGVNE